MVVPELMFRERTELDHVRLPGFRGNTAHALGNEGHKGHVARPATATIQDPDERFMEQVLPLQSNRPQAAQARQLGQARGVG